MNKDYKYLNHEFVRAVLPAVVTSIVLGTFSIIDGLFIGWKLGDVGLAGINFAYPVTGFIQAVGFGLGMGGSVCFSVAKGKGDGSEKSYLFGTYLLMLVAIFFMTLIYFVRVPLLQFFGAEGETLDVAEKYLKVVVYGTAFQVMGQGLVSVVRNFGYYTYTMIVMSVSFVLNIFLDYVFLYLTPMGLAGTALATLLSQAIISISCIVILVRKKYRPIVSFNGKQLLEILTVSISPFGTFFSPNIVLIVINMTAVKVAGDIAVATYTAVSYMTYVAMRIIQGFGDGAQPLISFYEGKGDEDAKRFIVKKTFVVTEVFSILFTVVSILLRNKIGLITGISNEALGLFPACLTWLISPLVAYGFMRTSMTVFYAQKKNLFSSVLVYAEPIIVAIVAFSLPAIMGLNGVWISAPISQILLAMLGGYFLFKTK